MSLNNPHAVCHIHSTSPAPKYILVTSYQVREGISIGIGGAWPVFNIKIIWLQSQVPSRQMGIGVLKLIKPLESTVVSLDSKPSTQQVHSEGLNAETDC